MTIGDCCFVSCISKDAVLFFHWLGIAPGFGDIFPTCCVLWIHASMVVPTVCGAGVSSEWMFMAEALAHSSMRWQAAFLLRLASMAFLVYARMYSAVGSLLSPVIL